MKKFFAAFIGALLAMSATGASAYTGGWEWDSSGQEFMILGDETDGTGLYLWGTNMYCGVPGDSYSHMHRVLDDRGRRGFIDWWIDRECNGGYVRVCVENQRGERGCSTYITTGWGDYYVD